MTLRAALCCAALSVSLLPSLAAAAPLPDGSTVLISRPSGDATYTGRYDGSSTAEAISADGRYVVMTTSTDAMASGVDPGQRALVLRDRVARSTVLVARSDGPDGVAASPGYVSTSGTRAAVAVAPAGSVSAAPAGVPHVLVAFVSEATNLVDHATGATIGAPSTARIWLRDVTAGTTTLVSRAEGINGTPYPATSLTPSLDVSPAGPLVAFARPGYATVVRVVEGAHSVAFGCVQSGCNAGFVEGAEPSVRVVNGPAGACTGSGPCVLVALSTTDASYTSGGVSQVILIRTPIVAGTLSPPGVGAVVSRRDGAGAAVGNASSMRPELTADGSTVGFTSRATNLTTDNVSGIELPYVRNTATARTFLVAKSPTTPDQGPGLNAHFSIGGAAGAIPRALFPTAASNLSFPGFPGGLDARAFLFDTAAGTTTMIDRSSDGTPGPSYSDGILSLDGNLAAVTSLSRVRGIVPRYSDVFGHDIDTGSDELVSRPTTGPVTEGVDVAFSGERVVSADGRYVVFATAADALAVPGGTRASEVYRRDVLTGITTLVSRADGVSGAAADRDAESPSISADGRRVAFLSAAGNLGPQTSSVQHAFVRDLDTATTTVASALDDIDGTPASATAGVISADGAHLAFVSNQPIFGELGRHVYVRDLVARRTSQREQTYAGIVSDVVAVNADGTVVAYVARAGAAGDSTSGPNEIRVYRRRVGGPPQLASVSPTGGVLAAARPQLDDGGDRVAFTPLALADRDNAHGEATALMVRRVSSATTTLATRADGLNGAPAGARLVGTLSGSGRFVIFATDSAALERPAGDTRVRTYVRDLDADRTRAVDPGGDGAIAVNGVGSTPDATCIVLSSRGGAGFSPDFDQVYLRAFGGDCAPGPPASAGSGASTDAAPIAGPGVLAGPAPGGSPPLSPLTTPARVRLARLALAPRAFATTGRHRGARLSFTLSHAARVTLTVDRLVAGRRATGTKACSTKRRRGNRCDVARRAGRLVLTARAGVTRRAFSGRLPKSARAKRASRLAPGRYRLTARPDGGHAASLTFRVKRR